MFTPLKKSLSVSLLVLFAHVGSVHAQASQPQALVEFQGQVFTTQDLEAELGRLAPDVRNSILFKKENLLQVVSNLFVRRIMARDAEKHGVLKDPTNAIIYRQAQDKAASDMFMTWMDARSKPPLAELDRRAQEIYKVEAKRFHISETVKASHILFMGDDAKAQAEAALAKLKAGSDFEAMAKELSKDPGSANKGGDLGFFDRGRMVPVFEETAFKLNVGELSEPVQSPFGVHIIKVTDKKPARQRPYDEVKDELYKEVIAKAQSDARMKYANEVMTNAKTSPELLDELVNKFKAGN